MTPLYRVCMRGFDNLSESRKESRVDIIRQLVCGPDIIDHLDLNDPDQGVSIGSDIKPLVHNA